MSLEAPDELGITIALTHAPPAPFVPLDQIGKKIIGLVLIWTGDPDLGQKVLAPFRAIGSPIVDLVRPMPYVALQSMLDSGAPHGRHYYWKGHRLPTLSDPTIETIVGHAAAMTSPFSQIGGWAVGGAVSRVDPDATAVGRREVGFEINLAAAWAPSDPNGERHVAWVREGWQALRPDSVGVYANFLSDEGVTGLEAAYGGRLARLTALKDRYDPDNVFHLNANIPPSRRS
jgi:hypothetical protein